MNLIEVTHIGIYMYIYHPIDSLYIVESVKGTVPVIERIFWQKMRDSGKCFACFRVISLFLCHSV